MDNNFKVTIVKSLFWKYGERIIAQIVNLIVAIVLARLLIPKDYGAVSLAMVFITIANVFVTYGLGTSLIQKENADSLDFSSIFYSNLILSILIYLIIYLIAPFLADFYDLSIIRPVLRVLGLRIIIASVNTVQHAYISRKMLFFCFFWSTLIGTIISGIVGINLAYQGFGIWALVVQYLLNTVIDTIVLFITVDWRPTLEFSFYRAKGLINYGWKIIVSALINTTYDQIRNLLVGKVYTMEDLAYYNQGDKYPAIIVGNIDVSISSVIFPAISRYQKDIVYVKQIIRRFIQIASYIIWPIMIGLFVCADSVVRLLLTDKWLPLVPYLRVFCIVYGFHPIHVANLETISAIGRSDIFLKLEIIKKIFGIIILMITIRISPFVMAMSVILHSIISTCINSFPNIKLLNYTYLEQSNDMFKPFILATIMGAIVYIVNFLNLSSVVTLLIQIPLGVFIYFMLSVLLHNETLIYLLRFFNIVK